MANYTTLKSLSWLGGLIIGGAVVLYYALRHLGMLHILPICLWIWVGMGFISMIAFTLRHLRSRTSAFILPSLFRLLLVPVWLIAGVLLFRPSIDSFLSITLIALGIFLSVEVALSIRKLRRSI
ncbi:MAG: hypothetical protein RMJ66_00915 [Bacteroidia bacterium]|nr:hypothetical protein [Bacteroidia bacterium]MDW8133605.1 hypothetical protein [Bacteroidia bacterium]